MESDLVEHLKTLIKIGKDDNRNQILISCNTLTEVIQALSKIPETPTGEWIDTGWKEEEWAEIYKCSLCGSELYYGAYCSHCGAKMSGIRKPTEE